MLNKFQVARLLLTGAAIYLLLGPLRKETRLAVTFFKEQNRHNEAIATIIDEYTSEIQPEGIGLL